MNLREGITKILHALYIDKILQEGIEFYYRNFTDVFEQQNKRYKTSLSEQRKLYTKRLAEAQRTVMQVNQDRLLWEAERHDLVQQNIGLEQKVEQLTKAYSEQHDLAKRRHPAEITSRLLNLVNLYEQSSVPVILVDTKGDIIYTNIEEATGLIFRRFRRKVRLIGKRYNSFVQENAFPGESTNPYNVREIKIGGHIYSVDKTKRLRINGEVYLTRIRFRRLGTIQEFLENLQRKIEDKMHHKETLPKTEGA